MASKLALVDLENLESQQSAVQTLAENNREIEDAVEDSFSRTGRVPNTIATNIDMDGYRIMNLGSPQSGSEPVRLKDIQASYAVDVLLIPDLEGNEGRNLSTDGDALVFTNAGTGDMKAENNLADVDDVGAARDNLGLGNAALKNTGTSGNNVPLLDGDNDWSGEQTFLDAIETNAAVDFKSSTILTFNPTSTLSDRQIGYLGAPHVNRDTTDFLVLSDAGKSLVHSSGTAHTYAIPPNTQAAFPLGTTIVIVNTGSGQLTLSPAAGVSLRIAGNATDGIKYLAHHGIATLYKAGTNSWYLTGSGLSAPTA